MIVTVKYDSKRTDVFDTASLTASQPFPHTNILSDFELRYDGIEAKGLWIEAHYYAASQSFRDSTTEGEVPVARRKMGWRILLAQKNEVAHILSVELDGTAVLRRAEGALFDCARFEECASHYLESEPEALYPRVLALAEVMAQVNKGLGKPSDLESIAPEFGFTKQTILDIEACMASSDEDDACEEDDELEDEYESD